LPRIAPYSAIMFQAWTARQHRPDLDVLAGLQSDEVFRGGGIPSEMAGEAQRALHVRRCDLLEFFLPPGHGQKQAHTRTSLQLP
jgi:hypothetical protein